MIPPCQKDAWNELYETQSRPWKGVASTIDFPFEKGNRILDVGCGNGKTSYALIELGCIVTGIDISEAAVDSCKRMYGDAMNAIRASADSIPLENRSMDGAVMVHVLEHMTPGETEAALREIRRVLKMNAKIFVRVFHKDDMRSDKGERIDENTVVRGNGIRYRYFSETELKNVFLDFREITTKRVDEMTKFKEKRSRIESIFERTA
ncbi:MAG: methyltransferase domain-containing protein [Methanomassiliicoccaceae archaeon]|nr:methyltransferase domain-containing protein [Methanomassiliicoccaceae archaeon]